MNITTSGEFIARRLADASCRSKGLDAQRAGAHQLAAKLYKAGASVTRAAREAVRTKQAAQ